ncbi:fusion protein [Klebsiella phage KMI1]|uniref:Fusion protein n=1 Tax=Klebsiella phage KMI1 TaxID=2589653 RepID=A0A514U698_9CAUD|nr:fusion protein [Klebsiella phage KMI1]
MTYSIVVTILLIVLIVLFVRATTRLATCEYTLEKQSKSNEEYTDILHDKVCRLADDKASLSKQVRWLESRLEEEKQKERDEKELRGRQRERMKFLRKSLKEVQNELLMVSDLIHIKFTARLPDGQPVKTLFKLGLGPCGLHVKSLRWTELEDRYLIDQLCTNGERKQFVYYKNEVVGRIEFRHGKA